MQARKRAQLLITKSVQNETLAEEIKCLEEQKELPKSSPLIKLSPVLGSEELIRVGGRLDWADLPYEERHPLILSGIHHVSSLIVDQFTTK